MKILHLCERYRPHVGGLELAVERLATQQAAVGHEVHLATLAPRRTGLPELSTESGVIVHRLPHLPLGEYHPPAPEPIVVRALRSLLRAAKPQYDVVHGHGLMGFSFLALKRLGLAELPFVWKIPDYGLICPIRTRLYSDGSLCTHASTGRCLECAGRIYGRPKAAACMAGLALSRPLLKSVDAWVAPSGAVAAPHGLRDVNIIPPGVVLPERLDEVAAPDFAPAEPYLMYAGRVSPAKGTDVLLAAYGQLSEPRPPLVIVAAAGGQLAGPVPPGVRLATDVPHGQVLALWAGAMIAVIPSIWGDPSPTVAGEAMAAAVPIVASRVGGLPEIVGESGILVDPGDADQLASAISRLIREPTLRARLGETGRRMIAAHSIELLASKVDLVYDKAIRSQGDRASGSMGVSLAEHPVAGFGSSDRPGAADSCSRCGFTQ